MSVAGKSSTGRLASTTTGRRPDSSVLPPPTRIGPNNPPHSIASKSAMACTGRSFMVPLGVLSSRVSMSANRCDASSDHTRRGKAAMRLISGVRRTTWLPKGDRLAFTNLAWGSTHECLIDPYDRETSLPPVRFELRLSCQMREKERRTHRAGACSYENYLPQY